LVSLLFGEQGALPKETQNGMKTGDRTHDGAGNSSVIALLRDLIIYSFQDETALAPPWMLNASLAVEGSGAQSEDVHGKKRKRRPYDRSPKIEQHAYYHSLVNNVEPCAPAPLSPFLGGQKGQEK